MRAQFGHGLGVESRDEMVRIGFGDFGPLFFGQPVGLVHQNHGRDVVQGKVVKNFIDAHDLVGEIGIGGVHHVEQQIRFA